MTDVGLALIAGPAVEPVSLDEAKTHLRVDHSSSDAEIQSLITGARQWLEEFTARTMVDTTLELSFEGYPGARIDLRRAPIIDIVSFSYTDSNGAAQVIDEDDYELVNATGLAPQLAPTYSAIWPATRYQPGSLKVRYRAGYADRTGSPTQDPADYVPEPLRTAIKLHLEAHFDRDERTFDMLIKAAENLARPYRSTVGF